MRILLPSRTNFLDHYLWLGDSLAAHEAEAILGMNESQILIRKGDRKWQLFPKFLVRASEGHYYYSSRPNEDRNIFAGWLPYEHKNWALAADKLAFKQAAKDLMIRVPPYSIDPDADMVDVFVKQARSSFGAQISGPYRSSKERVLDSAKGEYYERFIRGRILKVWYWNATPICLELETMPYILGDGVTPLREHLFRRARMNRSVTEEEMAPLLRSRQALLRYYGVDAGTVVERGKRQLIEFRYGTDWMHPRDRVVVQLNPDEPFKELDQPFLFDLGPRLAQAIPPTIRQNTLFTVDAIVDGSGKMWFLKMNCNPAVHPLVYPAIIGSLLAE